MSCTCTCTSTNVKVLVLYLSTFTCTLPHACLQLDRHCYLSPLSPSHQVVLLSSHGQLNQPPGDEKAGHDTEGRLTG